MLARQKVLQPSEHSQCCLESWAEHGANTDSSVRLCKSSPPDSQKSNRPGCLDTRKQQRHFRSPDETKHLQTTRDTPKNVQHPSHQALIEFAAKTIFSFRLKTGKTIQKFDLSLANSIRCIEGNQIMTISILSLVNPQSAYETCQSSQQANTTTLTMQPQKALGKNALSQHQP